MWRSALTLPYNLESKAAARGTRNGRLFNDSGANAHLNIRFRISTGLKGLPERTHLGKVLETVRHAGYAAKISAGPNVINTRHLNGVLGVASVFCGVVHRTQSSARK